MSFGGVNGNVQDVKVFRAKKDSWGNKPGGGNKAVYSHTLDAVGIMPRTTKTAEGEGFQGRVSAGRSLFVEVDADILADDEVELVERLGNTTRWRVDGSADVDYSNPLSTWQPGVEVQITKIGGR